MSLSVKEIDTPELLRQWREYVVRHSYGTYLQLPEWAELKNQYGWTAELVGVLDGSHLVGGALMLRRLAAMGLSIDYVAYGPLWDEGRDEALICLLDELESRSQRSVMLRVEPNVTSDKAIELIKSQLEKRGFGYSPTMTQPEATLILDTSMPEDELLAGMRQTTRRYIRKAEKQGVVVEIDTTGDSLAEFYRILKQVDDRKRFGIHVEEYYRLVWKLFEKEAGSTQPYLFLVKKDGVCLGAYFLVRVGQKSWELYGGVSEGGMRLKANYLLKWRSIQTMKQAGVTHYDQWGVAPMKSEQVDRRPSTVDSGSSHPLMGVTYFKEGYGGRRVEYMGQWDKANNRFVYNVAKVLKKL